MTKPTNNEKQLEIDKLEQQLVDLWDKYESHHEAMHDTYKEIARVEVELSELDGREI